MGGQLPIPEGRDTIESSFFNHAIAFEIMLTALFDFALIQINSRRLGVIGAKPHMLDCTDKNDPTCAH